MVGQLGRILPVKIEEEMRSAYLDYAMSVIVARALPDVRDGLKPVQRRILYAMQEMGIGPGQPYRKSARIVGEVLGKFHPHGDAAVYDAMVRLAQPFTMRYQLVDGQGNFGSIDDDPPAAMRYTEARLATIAQELLANIDEDTVDFTLNFDNSLEEPPVLPSRLPNLMVNGASGIAVGMATSIPPHNLREICDAIVHLIDQPEASAEDLTRFVKGPDFPTGGLIVFGERDGRRELANAYTTGRGRVTVRARAEIEELRSNRYAIVVTELPYQVNKATLVARIAELVKERRVEGISEVRDESDREGIRVVVELRREAQPQKVLNNLYKFTALQTAFHFNMLALVGGQPMVLSLKQSLLHFISFREEVVRRRSQHRLRKAQERAHILEGLLVALNNLDAVIALIRNAPDVETARQQLMEGFSLSQPQAQAILDMQLRRLAALERQKIFEEHEELMARIRELEELLADPQRIRSVVAQETRDLAEKYGDSRRTQFLEADVDQSREDLEPHEEVVVTISQRHYIKRIPSAIYNRQRRGGKGVRGMTTRDDDAVEHLLVADSHDTILFFTNLGKVYSLRCFDLPKDSSRTTRGMPLMNFQQVALAPQERVQDIVAVQSLEQGGELLIATRLGEIKRMALSDLGTLRSRGLIVMDLEPGDEVVDVALVQPEEQVLMVTERGMAIRFAVSDGPLRSRIAGGVRGIRLSRNDQVVAMGIADPEAELLLFSEYGYGKRTPIRMFPTQRRSGQGLKAFNVTGKTGRLAAAQVIHNCEEIVVGSAQAQVIRVSLSEIPALGRATQGVIVWRPAEGDRLVSVACLNTAPREGHAATDEEDGASPNGHESHAQLTLTIEGEESEDNEDEGPGDDSDGSPGEDGAGAEP